MVYSINQFLKIIFSEGKVILVNSQKDREFVSDFQFLYVLSKLGTEKNFPPERFEEIYTEVYGMWSAFPWIFGKLIENEIIIDINSDISITYTQFKPWFQNWWGDTLHYLLSTKDYPFIQYEDALWFIEDSELMKEYLSSNDFYPYKKDIPSASSKNLPVALPWPQKGLPSFFGNMEGALADNIAEYSEFERIWIVMRAAFWALEENSFWHGKFPKKIPPSGWSRHPSSGYLCDIYWDIWEKGTSYLYQQYLHSLLPIDKNEELEAALNDWCYNFLQHSGFQARYCIFITSDYVKSMWRYRDSRSYRVLYNDCGHIVRILNYTLKLMGYTFQEFSFIDEEKIAAILKLELGENKCEHPIYGLFIR